MFAFLSCELDSFTYPELILNNLRRKYLWQGVQVGHKTKRLRTSELISYSVRHYFTWWWRQIHNYQEIKKRSWAKQTTVFIIVSSYLLLYYKIWNVARIRLNISLLRVPKMQQDSLFFSWFTDSCGLNSLTLRVWLLITVQVPSVSGICALRVLCSI